MLHVLNRLMKINSNPPILYLALKLCVLPQSHHILELVPPHNVSVWVNINYGWKIWIEFTTELKPQIGQTSAIGLSDIKHLQKFVFQSGCSVLQRGTN